MGLAEQRPTYYDIEKFDAPTNDLDCIATITGFSATLIFISLPRQGIWMRSDEKKYYVALWRYAAYLTGAPKKAFETPEKAKCYLEMIMLLEVDLSPTSWILASNVISCFQDQPPSFPSRPFLEANARWLNGDRLADALEIGRPGVYFRMLVAIQCLILATLVYINRSISSLDRKKTIVSVSVKPVA